MTSTALIPIVGAAAGVLASGAAKSLSGGLSFLAELTGGETTSQAPVTEALPTPAEKLTALDEKLQDFIRRFRERLLLGGVDPQQKLELQQEPWGSIAVSDDHPQKEQVEAILAADPLLASEFHQLADEYRQATEAAGQNLSGADVFQMSIGASGGTAGFVR
jgi:hypothetical protein